jgi:hypothetical protein
MHILPARHHLAQLVVQPSLPDAWKGAGAALAVAFLMLPTRSQAKLFVLLRGRAFITIAALALVLVHLVPASDHIPRFVSSPSFADGWRAAGTLVAVTWFAAPRTFQFAILRLLGRRIALRRSEFAADAN